MAEYIEREAAIKAAIDATDEWDGGYNGERAAIICRRLNHIPAANVRENVKAEWKHLGGDEWRCSACGNVISTEGSWEHPLSEDRQLYFCNICGADMREEEMEA